MLLNPVSSRFAPRSLAATTVFVPTFSGSVQTAAFPIGILRACLSETHVKDAIQDFLMKESQNSEKLHSEVLLHIFP